MTTFGVVKNHILIRHKLAIVTLKKKNVSAFIFKLKNTLETLKRLTYLTNLATILQ